MQSLWRHNLIQPSESPSLFNEYYAVFSTLKRVDGAGTYMTVRRSNDNAQTNIIYDESTPINTPISLASAVSDGGTLGDWLGANTLDVVSWINQTSSEAVDIRNTITNQQPRLSDASGNILTKSGFPALYFGDSADVKLRAITAPARFPVLDYGNDFAIFAVGNAEVGDTSPYFSTDPSSAGGINFRAYYRYSVENQCSVYDGALFYTAKGAAVRNTDALVQATSIVNGGAKTMSFWDNGTEGDQGVAFGVYQNDEFWMGRDRSSGGNQSSSYMAELIIADNINMDRAAIEEYQAAAFSISYPS